MLHKVSHARSNCVILRTTHSFGRRGGNRLYVRRVHRWLHFGCDAVELEYFAAICARTGASGPRNNAFV